MKSQNLVMFPFQITKTVAMIYSLIYSQNTSCSQIFIGYILAP